MDLLDKLDSLFEHLPDRYQNGIIHTAHCLLSRIWPFNGPYPPVSDGNPPGLEIKSSLIKEAGQGLFTTKTFNNGDNICQYIGTELSTLQVLRTKDWDYIYGDGDEWIDAKPHPNVFARYINDNFDESKINCEFSEQEGDEKIIWVKATRDIKPGEELFISYGERYWNLKKICL